MSQKLTDQKKVLRVLIENHKEWYYTYDFISNTYGTFLSHRGPARISELSLDYPELIETNRDEKTFKYRFRFENTLMGLQSLPKHLADFVKDELKINNRTYQEEVTIYERVNDNTVKAVNRVITR